MMATAAPRRTRVRVNTDRQFRERFTTGSGCWLWTARVDSDGYGQFSYKDRAVKAHRFSYELFVGPIPEGLQIDHLCRTRSCVRPDHLEPVTVQENVARIRSKLVCPQGHLYDEANTYRYKNARQCRKCRADRMKDWHARNKR